MKPRLVIASIGVSLLAVACGGGADPGSESPPDATVAPSPTATLESGATSGQVGPGKTLRSADGVLEVSGTSGAALDVSIRGAAKEPVPPGGWKLVSRVYELTAREPATGRTVTQLKDPFQLHFKSVEPLATVLWWDGDSWEIVRSDLANGVVEARIDHLSIYAVMRPAALGGQPKAAGSTATPVGQPGATVTPTTSPDAAKAALESAIRKYTGEAAAVAAPNSYMGAAELGVPQAVVAALAEAGVFGDVFHGVYNGVDEGFWGKATEGPAVGEYVLLIEPQTTFADNTSEAQRLLVALFPGAAGLQYAPVQSGPTAYTYQASNGSSFVVLGFVQHEGLALAFVSAGSGLYTHAIVSTK